MYTGATTPTHQVTLKTEDAMRLFQECMAVFEQLPVATDYLKAEIADQQYNQLEPIETTAEKLAIVLKTQATMLAGFTPIQGFFSAFVDWPLPEEDQHNVWEDFKTTYDECIKGNSVTMDLESGTGIPSNLYLKTLAFKEAGISVDNCPNINVSPEKKSVIQWLFGNSSEATDVQAGQQKLNALFA